MVSTANLASEEDVRLIEMKKLRQQALNAYQKIRNVFEPKNSVKRLSRGRSRPVYKIMCDDDTEYTNMVFKTEEDAKFFVELNGESNPHLFIEKVPVFVRKFWYTHTVCVLV